MRFQRQRKLREKAGPAPRHRRAQVPARPGHRVLHLQRAVGNRAAARLLRPARPGPTPGDADRPVTVNTPGDAFEREAERVARTVSDARAPGATGPEARVQTRGRPRPAGGEAAVSADVANRLNRSRGRGDRLSQDVRAFMEPRLMHDLGSVRIHTDREAAALNRRLGARAFTHDRDIYFSAGRYDPDSRAGMSLLAHELTHVVQQSAEGAGPAAPGIQRVLELRPPGPGEASAWDQRQDLVDRLNAQSAAIQYRLEGRVLHHQIVNEAELTYFDRQMRGFIDRAEVVPLRLITGAGYVRGAGGAFQPLLHDSWVTAYVDVDDLLASDDLGFQSQLIHYVAERFATRNYERRIGSPTFTVAEFQRVHRAGYRAEAALLQDVMGDPTIRHLYSESRPNGTWVVAFQSDEGYRIFKVFRRAGSEVQGAEVWARSADGRRLTIDQLRAERGRPAAAVP